MTRQLILDLPAIPALERADFFVSAANAAAVAAIESWSDWPQRKLALIGPHSSGKTHLARVWAAMSGARIVSAVELADADIAALATGGPCIVVEDVDAIAGLAQTEQALFHLHNLLLAEGGHLLLTGTGTPSRWQIHLADLASRVAGTGAVQLEAPDDDLLRAVLLKLFADRQIVVGPAVIEYLVRRMERRLDEAALLVERLDQTGLSQHRPITRALAASILDKSP